MIHFSFIQIVLQHTVNGPFIFCFSWTILWTVIHSYERCRELPFIIFAHERELNAVHFFAHERELNAVHFFRERAMLCLWPKNSIEHLKST